MHPIQQSLLQLSKIRDLSKLSYREIGRQLAEGSDDSHRIHPQNVKYHFDQLVADKLLTEADRPVRRVEPVKNANTFVMNLIRIPIVGSANCGPATIFADDKIEGYLEVSPGLLRSKNYQDLYALRASGDSMNRAVVMGKNINDGDYVLVDQSKRTPRDGECVVVVRDNVANIKCIYFDHEDEMIILRSESTHDYRPIYVSPNDDWDGLISGTVMQVIKNRAPAV